MKTKSGGYVAGVDNLSALFTDPAFRRAVTNNLLYAVATVPATLALALAWRWRWRGATGVERLADGLFLPTLIPLIAAASIFLFLFLPNGGLIDYYLAKLGRQGPNWLGDPDIALWSLSILTVWKNAGYYMLFFLAGLQGVSKDLLEAATLDGAGALARLRHVTLPALRETFAFVSVLALIGVFTQVDHVFVLTKGDLRTPPISSSSTSTSRLSSAMSLAGRRRPLLSRWPQSSPHGGIAAPL